MDENDIFNSDFNGDLLNYFPEENYGVISMSVNPESIYNIAKNQRKEDIEKFGEEYEKNVGISLDEQVESIGGSFILSVFDFAKTEYTSFNYYANEEETKETMMPILGFAFDFTNDNFIKKILKLIPERKLTKNGNYYEFKFDNKYPAYFAYNENTCFFTNGEEAIESFDNGGYSDNLSGADISTKIEESIMYYSMNLDFETYPKNIKDEFASDKNRSIKRMLGVWSEFAKRIEWQQIEDNTITVTLKVKNGDNSLNTLIVTIDENQEILQAI
jgi:hypothetical protein